jgi:uncharacterized membrane protein
MAVCTLEQNTLLKVLSFFITESYLTKQKQKQKNIGEDNGLWKNGLRKSQENKKN